MFLNNSFTKDLKLSHIIVLTVITIRYIKLQMRRWWFGAGWVLVSRFPDSGVWSEIWVSTNFTCKFDVWFLGTSHVMLCTFVKSSGLIRCSACGFYISHGILSHDDTFIFRSLFFTSREHIYIFFFTWSYTAHMIKYIILLWISIIFSVDR